MNTDHREPVAIHVVGVLLLLLAGVLAFGAAAMVSFGTSTCDEPSAAEQAELHRGLFVIAVAFAAVPALVGMWARRANGHFATWFTIAVCLLAVGGFAALTAEQANWCF